MNCELEIEITINRNQLVILNRQSELDSNIIKEIIKLPKYMRDILNNRPYHMLNFNFFTESNSDMTPYRLKLCSMFGNIYIMGDNMENAIKERFSNVETYRLRIGAHYVSNGYIEIN